MSFKTNWILQLKEAPGCSTYYSSDHANKNGHKHSALLKPVQNLFLHCILWNCGNFEMHYLQTLPLGSGSIGVHLGV